MSNRTFTATTYAWLTSWIGPDRIEGKIQSLLAICCDSAAVVDAEQFAAMDETGGIE